MAEDARAAIEWLTAGEEEDAPAVFTRRRLQLFLWYELPQKWLVEPDEHLAVAEALALFFDESGPSAAALAALCRDPDTMRLLREGGEGFVEAIEASGLEPPDTPLLEWSDLMTIEESLERDAVAEMLEQAVDDGRLVPGANGWLERQSALVESYLARIHAARRQAWLERAADDEQRALKRPGFLGGSFTCTTPSLPPRFRLAARGPAKAACRLFLHLPGCLRLCHPSLEAPPLTLDAP